MAKNNYNFFSFIIIIIITVLILLILVDNDGPWTHLVVERGDGQNCPIRVDHKIHVRGLQLGGQAVLLHTYSVLA